MTVGMNQYEIYLERPGSDGVASIKVNCNNVPCAVRKAVVLMAQKTGKCGWKYVRHRLVHRAWDDVVSAAEANRRYLSDLVRRGRC